LAASPYLFKLVPWFRFRLRGRRDFFAPAGLEAFSLSQDFLCGLLPSVFIPLCSFQVQQSVQMIFFFDLDTFVLIFFSPAEIGCVLAPLFTKLPYERALLPFWPMSSFLLFSSAQALALFFRKSRTPGIVLPDRSEPPSPPFFFFSSGFSKRP